MGIIEKISEFADDCANKNRRPVKYVLSLKEAFQLQSEMFDMPIFSSVTSNPFTGFSDVVGKVVPIYSIHKSRIYGVLIEIDFDGDGLSGGRWKPIRELDK